MVDQLPIKGLLTRGCFACIIGSDRSAIRLPASSAYQQYMMENERISVSSNVMRAEELLPLVYADLRRLAQRKLASEPPGQSIQATALVHEAYLRLVRGGDAGTWQSRNHFFAAAAESIRRILIERARRAKTEKHGVRWTRIELPDLADVGDWNRADKLLQLDAALDQLEEADPLKANLVKLRFFVGMTASEAAEALGISKATADRSWNYARSWLQRAMHEA